MSYSVNEIVGLQYSNPSKSSLKSSDLPKYCLIFEYLSG